MNMEAFDRKPIFDAVRAILDRGFSQAEVDAIELAIDRARSGPRLGALSEKYESGGRGPGTVSGGKGDPGGVSYGTYQLASRTGTVDAFLKQEGARWRGELSLAVPGSPVFGSAWKAIAAREPHAFADAQHGFIERTHFAPAVKTVKRRTGLDLAACRPAVREAVWSVAVQHGGAVRILCNAVARADRVPGRAAPDYQRRLIEEIFATRCDYVLAVAGRSSASARRTLESVVRNRYPEELATTLAMFDAAA